MYYVILNQTKSFFQMFPQDIADRIFLHNDNVLHRFLFGVICIGPHYHFRFRFPLRRASTQGYVEVVQMMLQNPKVNIPKYGHYGLVTEFEMASYHGHLAVVNLLLNNTKHRNSYQAVYLASQEYHVKIAKLLLLQDEEIDPSMHNNYYIRMACRRGQLELVRLLLQDRRVDPSDDDNDSICQASKHGHWEVVQLLLQDKRVDPSAKYNYAIQHASANGHEEVVRLLLQDESVDPVESHRIAAKNSHWHVVKLLLNDSRLYQKM